LTKDFYASLGEVISLKELDLTNTGKMNTANATLIGKAIAFNSKK